MMHGFEFYTPTRVILGAGSLEKLPEAVGRCGAKRVFGVHNFGPAIPPDEQARVFDRFFRGMTVEVFYFFFKGFSVA